MRSRAVRGDQPVDSSADFLGRAAIAGEWARLIASSEPRDGLVVAVNGRWGSGKTSMLNMLRETLHGLGVVTVDFNPWMFSGTGDLVGSYFTEMASQINVRAGVSQVIGQALKKYAQVLTPMKAIPIAGDALSAIGSSMTAAGNLVTGNPPSVIEQRNALVNSLNELAAPIVVLIDDIDRLTDTEISDIMRLVRLVGAFPNLIYVLAMDRSRVERAVDSSGQSGTEYLEKIVQVILNVPSISRTKLGAVLREEISHTLSSGPTGLDVLGWDDDFDILILPLFKSIRDVRRYIATLGVTLGVVGKSVCMRDQLVLEAVRVLTPRVFDMLPSAADALTTPTRKEPEERAMVETLLQIVAAHPEQRQLMILILSRLFPYSGERLGIATASLDNDAHRLRPAHIAAAISRPQRFRAYIESVAAVEEAIVAADTPPGNFFG